jgi:signal transduction histidine kinase
MKWYGHRIAAWALYGFLVLVPTAVLTSMAWRSIRQEEGSAREQARLLLQSETSQAAHVIRQKMDAVKKELEARFVMRSAEDWSRQVSEWKALGTMAVPVLLSGGETVLDVGETKSDSYNLLAKDYRDAIEQDKKVLSYQNVAHAYSSDILKQKEETARQAGLPAVRKSLQLSQEPERAEQEAEAVFAESKEIREKVMQKAQAEGQAVLQRKIPVFPKEAKREESVLVTQAVRLDALIAEQESGMLPRLINGQLSIFFWKKVPGTTLIAGGILSLEEVLKRISTAISPVLGNEFRFLVLYNEEGKPVPLPRGRLPRAQETPLASWEIGSVLPHWEVAAFLMDPEKLQQQMDSRRTLLMFLLGTLLAMLIPGTWIITQAWRASLLTALQQTSFVDNVSHELKTPLSSILLFSEMLRWKKDLTPEKKEKYLDTVIGETHRLDRIVTNTLTFSRIRRHAALKKAPCDLSRTIREAWDSQKDVLDKRGFRLEESIQEKILLRADADSLRQVVLNLVSNAEKYSPEKKEIEIVLAASGKEAVLEISDRGIGVPPSERKKIFQEFYRVDSRLSASASGSGIGLYIVKNIVEGHGGVVSCRARPDGGSIFRVSLPLA